MMEIAANLPEGTIGFVASGRVTKKDYDAVLIPAVEAAFKRSAKVRLYYEIGRDFSGFEAGAMVEDFAVGIRHLGQWERVAVVTDLDWMAHATKAFAFLMPGKVKVFPFNRASEARAWLAEK